MRAELNKAKFVQRDPELLKMWAQLAQDGVITPEEYFEILEDVKGEDQLKGVLDRTIQLPELTEEQRIVFDSRHEGPLGELLRKPLEDKE